MAEKDRTVSTVDEVLDKAHDRDRTRKVSDYKPSNAPLSQDQIENEGKVDELRPLPEKPSPPNDVD